MKMSKVVNLIAKGCVWLVLITTSVFASESTFDCMVYANQIIDIRSPVTGILEAVPYQRGDKIVRGNILATLESSVEKSRLKLAKYKFEVDGALNMNKIRLKMLTNRYERLKGLALDNSFVPVQEIDDADLERQLAIGELKKTAEEKMFSKIELRLAKNELARRRLISPIDGVVVGQYAHPGELVDPSESREPILKLAQYDPLRVEVVLPVSEYGSVNVGDFGLISLEAPIGGKYKTKVTLVDQVIDAASGTFGIQLEIANPNLEIPPGIKCKIYFSVQ